jgi:hypothetical protein
VGGCGAAGASAEVVGGTFSSSQRVRSAEM